jgi:hypothetical protein
VKNDEGRPAGAPRSLHLTLEGDGSREPGRREPRLVVEVPLEGRPRVTIDAARLEDELRLRAWLRAAERRLARVIADAIARAA